MTVASVVDRVPVIEASLLRILSDISGESLSASDSSATFLELGFDSLLIGQFAQKVEREYKVKISFRELLSNIPSIADLARHLDREMPADKAPAAAAPVAAQAAAAAPVQVVSQPVMPVAAPRINPLPAASGTGLEALMQSQLQVMQSLFAQQMALMQGGVSEAALMPAQVVVPAAPAPQPVTEAAPAAPAAVAAPTAPEGEGGGGAPQASRPMKLLSLKSCAAAMY